MKRAAGILILSMAGALSAGVVAAGELIYRPLNPSFGGNPNMSSHPIGLAQIQNRFAGRGGGGGGGGAPPQINFPPITIDLGGIGGGGGNNGGGNGNGGNGDGVAEGFAVNNGVEQVSTTD